MLTRSALPAAFAAVLAGLAAACPVRDSPAALASFLTAAAALMLWNVGLVFRRRPDRPVLEVRLSRQHYLQAGAQLAVLLYWGAYWSEVYTSAPFILAQLAFAYGFDLLLGWSRRGILALGFGPVPVVFSINLFLWFRPDWFGLQFLMIALGFGAKEFVRWQRDGRWVHVFNPSALPLGIFSVGLILTDSSHLTWGGEIAITQFYPPHIYPLLFLVGLPAGYLFGVSLMTMSAVVSTYAFGLIYFASTGIYYFYDSYIPVAVFLGMHLLFNDPATSPRTDPGRVAYGVLYGVGILALYALLGNAGAPTFYDKLLAVPLLNLSVRSLDALARSPLFGKRPRRPEPEPAGSATTTRRLATASIWVAVFFAMSVANGVGDNHPGQFLPFWQEACETGRAYACPYLADTELNLCDQGSGWACNEAGLLHVDLAASGEDLRRQDSSDASGAFRRGCDLGLAAACRNLDSLAREDLDDLVRQRPPVEELPILLRGSKGPIIENGPSALYQRACRQGWVDTCDRAGS